MPSLHIFKLATLHEHPTVDFAVRELEKYVRLMAGGECEIEHGKEPGRQAETGDRLTLGLFEDFGLSTGGLEIPELDDAIRIEVKGTSGMIAGSNARSVLLAVYRFLEEAGCRFIRPGAAGEHIPQRKLEEISVSVNEKASYRHRGLCIEGAVSLENMRENIEWAPKRGFNSYFLEFKTPFIFFDRWYSHRNNKYKQPEPVTPEQVDAFTRELEQEIKLRGLIYHAVGHGWTGEPLGLPCLGWDSVDYEVPEEISRYFAEVNGKRELWHGVPLNTNLCFSNPETRRLVVQYAADHAETNRHIDMLNFWLADAFNNHCECEKCRTKSPTDWYVMMLNELDEALTVRGLGTRVVFLLYLDLLWKPETERLHNPSRFVLLFAPISRTYSKTYDADTTSITIPPYVRNRLKFPSGIRENVAFLKEWQKLFEGDSFAYEYHFMWDHYYDPGYYQMAEMISTDMKNLQMLGLRGVISDQTQRSFFPTGLGMYVMGKTLWNDKLDFLALAKQFFQDSFGADGEACMTYMARLSELFDPPYLRGEKPRVSREAAEKLAQVRGVVEEFMPLVEKNLAVGYEACRARSWEYLRFHAEIVTLLAAAFQARAEGNLEEAQRLWNEVTDIVQRNEDSCQPDFDVCMFIQTLNKEFQSEKKTHFGGEVT